MATPPKGLDSMTRLLGRMLISTPPERTGNARSPKDEKFITPEDKIRSKDPNTPEPPMKKKRRVVVEGIVLESQFR